MLRGVADLTTPISVGVLALVGVRLVSSARVGASRRGRVQSLVILRRVGWRHVWPVAIVFPVVLTAAIALSSLPVLSWGWWSSLGGEGNAIFGSSDVTAGTAWEWIVPAVFILLLLPALPLFALAEERVFRAGAEDWSWLRRAVRTLAFGLIHAVVGIPLGAALALSLGGAYFMTVYLRRFARFGSQGDATIESSAAHLVYNAVIISLVLCSILLLAALP
jgi:hypothetical protein